MKLRTNIEWVEQKPSARRWPAPAASKGRRRRMGISQRALSYYLTKYKIEVR
jgi:hypothetical protein